MFDLFGLEKVNARDSVELIAKGFSKGMTDSFLDEITTTRDRVLELQKESKAKDEQIAKLAIEINDLKKQLEAKNVTQKTIKR